jgi:hypothetical protein
MEKAATSTAGTSDAKDGPDRVELESTQGKGAVKKYRTKKTARTRRIQQQTMCAKAQIEDRTKKVLLGEVNPFGLDEKKTQSRGASETSLRARIANGNAMSIPPETHRVAYEINVWSGGVCRLVKKGVALRSRVREDATFMMNALELSKYACSRPLCTLSATGSQLVFLDRNTEDANRHHTTNSATFTFDFVADIYVMCGMRSHLIASVLDWESTPLLTTASSNVNTKASKSVAPVFFDATGVEVARPDVKITHLVTNTNCNSCGAAIPYTSTKTKCSRCKRAYYCDEQCQRAHWKAGHKQACTPYHENTAVSSLPFLFPSTSPALHVTALPRRKLSATRSPTPELD